MPLCDGIAGLRYGHAARRELRVARRQDSDAGRDNGKRASERFFQRAAHRSHSTCERSFRRSDDRYRWKIFNLSSRQRHYRRYLCGHDYTEIPVNGRRTIDITLDNNAVNLDDVVVIGYGTQSRATVTSAITKVKAEDMAVMPSNNVMSMLQGKVPGMQVNFSSGRPGVSPAVTIRGGTTTTPGSDAPLYIIDGVIRTITDLNYADIESVEVLKDAASTAIYGAKAANGIVMITTKQGKKGAGRISVSYGLSIDHQPKRIPISDAREYLSITREAATRAYNPDKYLNGSFGMSTNNVIDSYVNCAFLDDWITVIWPGICGEPSYQPRLGDYGRPGNPGQDAPL